MARIGAVPAAMMIESAVDMPFDDDSNTKALKELEESGAELKAGNEANFQDGFLLGLRTARVMVLEGAWSRDSITEDAQH